VGGTGGALELDDFTEELEELLEGLVPEEDDFVFF
jgi:hypothetical protein